MLIEPSRPKRVYAVSQGGSVYRSDDAGESWTPAAGGLPAGGIEGLALDPRQPERLYAAGAAGLIYLSEDGGGSWQPLPGAAGEGGR